MKNNTNILVYKISYKTLIGGKPLLYRFNEVDGHIRVYDGTRYLVLFRPEESDAIYNRIRYLISQKAGNSYLFSHNYILIEIDSHDFLPP